MWRCVAVVRTGDSEKRIASIIRVEWISELVTTWAVTSGLLRLVVIARPFCHHDDRDDAFLRNVGSYKSHTSSHPRIPHSSDYAYNLAVHIDCKTSVSSSYLFDFSCAQKLRRLPRTVIFLHTRQRIYCRYISVRPNIISNMPLWLATLLWLLIPINVRA
jgi:hypothetical protein